VGVRRRVGGRVGWGGSSDRSRLTATERVRVDGCRAGSVRSIRLCPVTFVSWECADGRYFNFHRYYLRPTRVTISSVGPL
jgi:hypothetical protein